MTDDDLLEQMEEDASSAYADVRTREIAEEAHALAEAIDDLETQAAAKKRKLDDLMKRVLPDRMMADGLKSIDWVDDSGKEIRLMLEDKVVGSLSYAPDEDAAVAYLEAEGFAGAVKTVLQTDFTEEEKELAYQALEIVEADVGRKFSLKRTINPQTLMAFGRARIADNPDFDFEKVGLKHWTQTKFTKR